MDITMDTYIITSVIKSPAGVAVRFESQNGSDPAVREILMTEKCWQSFSFAEGDSITEKEADMLEGEAEFCRAYAAALRVFSYSSQSRSVLIRKLCRQGFSKEVAGRAADHAEEEGILDEEKEASHMADYYVRHKYWGKKRIAAELMAKGYGKATVFVAVRSIDEELYAVNLAKLLDKKPMPEEKADRDRYIAALCRMGYSLPEILKAAKQAE